ncbi:hypothetical protein ACWFNE_09310 [Cellulomonas sp. NPDC055163]
MSDSMGLDDLPHLDEDELVFNGVELETGAALFPPTRLSELAIAVRGDARDPAHVADLAARHRADTEDHLGVVYGRAPDDLRQVGWCLVAADDVGPDVRDALAPLCDWRREQSGDLFRMLTGPSDGVHRSEGKHEFLLRHRVATMDVVDPRQLPYYLLLVGSPEQISFSLQYQLDVQYAVGRVHFDTAEEYAQYARNVVAAEKRDRTASGVSYVFAPRNPADLPTALSSSRLALPLVEHLREAGADVDADLAAGATKRRLGELLQGDRPLDLLFTATHGVGTAGPRQRDIQGALLCQDWGGPTRTQPLTGEEYLSGADLDTARAVAPNVVFSFACYSAGTPDVSDFLHAPTPAASADPPFVARLPQRLLAHPRGGCLSFVGHVDRAWNCSFLWKGLDPRIIRFTSCVDAYLAGAPIGLAMEYVNASYATSATDLVNLQHRMRSSGLNVPDRTLAELWLATNDARNFLVLGDPAVRAPSSPRPTISA